MTSKIILSVIGSKWYYSIGILPIIQLLIVEDGWFEEAESKPSPMSQFEFNHCKKR